jgi:glycosyltransferase involved in cell wall biosynthesis
MKHISFVVPVYNGSSTIEALYERLVKVGSTLGSYEIIFVNDGSDDASLDILYHLQKKKCDIVVVDLNPPEEIPRLIAKLEDGYDVVYGIAEQRAHSPLRNFSSEVSKWISRKILSTAIKGNFSSFRVIRRWVVDEIVRYDSYYLFIDGLISWTTANIAGVIVRDDKTKHGSQYTFFKLVNHGLNLLVNFSIRPLEIASIVGAISALLGLIAAVYVILVKIIYNIPIQGWTSLMVAVLVIGGMQIIFLGLIGEYIGRILMNSNKSPKYIIKSIKHGTRRHKKK